MTRPCARSVGREIGTDCALRSCRMAGARSHGTVLRLSHPQGGADATTMRRSDDVRPTLLGGATARSRIGAVLSERSLAVPARRIEQENRSAASLSPDDARWVLARRVAEAIEGERAAIIRPEVRIRLVAIGQRLGLRPFDANLIIAIVQDDVRTATHGIAGNDRSLSGDVASRLGIVRRPDVSPSRRLVWIMAGFALATGVAVALLAINWIRSG